jgi:S1-C subfamily serine protease
MTFVIVGPGFSISIYRQNLPDCLSDALAYLLALTLCGLLAANPCRPQTRREKPRTETPVSTLTTLPFEDARRMTLLVRIKGQFESRGSAVWIGKSGYVATCYHVIKNVQLPLVVGMPHDPIFAIGNMNLAISGEVNTVDVTVAAFDESTDVAILKASRPPGQSQTPLGA